MDGRREEGRDRDLEWVVVVVLVDDGEEEDSTDGLTLRRREVVDDLLPQRSPSTEPVWERATLATSSDFVVLDVVVVDREED